MHRSSILTVYQLEHLTSNNHTTDGVKCANVKDKTAIVSSWEDNFNSLHLQFYYNQ